MQTLYSHLPKKSISNEEFYVRYKKYKVSEITKESFWKDLTENPDETGHKYLDTYILHKNIESIIESLKKEYRIVALTNHPVDWVKYIRSKFRLDDLFEKIYTSGNLKLEKTNKDSFKKILKALGAKGSDCILIDDLKKNLATARSCGIKTIYVKMHDDPTDFTPDAEISSLEELAGVLKRMSQT